MISLSQIFEWSRCHREKHRAHPLASHTRCQRGAQPEPSDIQMRSKRKAVRLCRRCGQNAALSRALVQPHRLAVLPSVFLTLLLDSP